MDVEQSALGLKAALLSTAAVPSRVRCCSATNAEPIMSATRTPAKHFTPLAVGAPEPFRQLPVRLERMIHFVPPHNEKIRARLAELIPQVDVVLGNLEDAIPADAKVAARRGFIEMAKAHDFGQTGLWTRINALNSPWALDDILEIVPAAGAKLDVIMLPKVEGPWDIHYLDQLLAQLEAKHALPTPDPDPRHPGDGGGRQQRGGHRRRQPAHARHEPGPGGSGRLARHEDDARRRRPSGLRHPGRRRAAPATPRAFFQQDLWHYTLARMVDACLAYGIKAFYGPFGDFSDAAACEAQFRNAFLHGCVGAWTLHPTQIDIAKRVFSLEPGGGGVRQAHRRGHAGRHRRGHDRRQDAGRCHLEAGQGHSRPGQAGGDQGSGAQGALWPVDAAIRSARRRATRHGLSH